MISVCIATFNGEKFIRQQMDSIICQINENDEIIISDDGSTDNTISILNSIGDKRIRIIEGPQKKSPILNFECAIRNAKGDYIFLSDQDDVWKPNKVEICMDYLKKYYCVVSDAEVTDSNLKPIHPSLFNLLNVKQNILYNTIWKNGYSGCCMAFRREVLSRALPFPKNITMHDMWIGNVAAYKYNVKFINDKLIYFRRHDKSSSFTGMGSRNSLLKKISIRINNIINVISLLK